MKERTLTDHLGIPLPIVGKLSAEDGGNNEHHHWHPRHDFKDRGRHTGAAALRSCRIQKVAIHDHDNYHAHFWGLDVPETRLERFGGVLLCTAGYVPEEGVSFHGDTYSVVPLSRRVRRRMWESGQIRFPYSSGREFMLSEVVRYLDQTNQNSTRLDEFLNTNKTERRIALARKLVLDAARYGSEPIRLEYIRAWREGRLPRAVRVGPRLHTAQQTPEEVALRSLMSRSHATHVVDRLQGAIAA